MKYKEKETGYEIEAVQYMTENKDEIVEFAGKNAVVEDSPDGLDITWGNKEDHTTIYLTYADWIMKDNRLGKEHGIRHCYSSMKNGDFRKIFEPIDDEEFYKEERLYPF